MLTQFKKDFLEKNNNQIYLNSTGKMTANGDASDDSKKSNGVDSGMQLITEEIFHDILEKQFGKCTIKKFTVAPSSSAGENYLCYMYRVTIEVEKEGMV